MFPFKGPAIHLNLGSTVDSVSDRFNGDVTFALKCHDWPEVISDWSRRWNRKWPSEMEVVRIISRGCHLVPKSQKDDKEGLTWRMSFSQAEVELASLVPPIARACFIGLKVICKDYLSIACKKLGSYQLKCIFYYTLERTDPEISSNIEKCFHLLLSNLKLAVANRHCPHFWIPEINLFQDLRKKEARKLLKIIEKVQRKAEEYIEDVNFDKRSKGKDKAEETIITIEDNEPSLWNVWKYREMKRMAHNVFGIPFIYSNQVTF